MFAHIYPIIRIPRRFGYFDYEIPDGLTLTPGDVVRIPFRQREVWGVVLNVVQTSSETRTRMVLAKDPTFTMCQKNLASLRSLAKELGQSVSSVLAVAYDGLTQEPPARIPTTQKRSSPSIDAPTTEIVKALLDHLEKHRRCAVTIDDETAIVLAHALCKTYTKQICLIVPRERDAIRLGNLLSIFTPAVLTGKTPSRARNAIIRRWRSGSLRVLIGTRQAALLSPHALNAVLLYQAGCDDHNAQRRNPYINNLRAAEMLANNTGACFVSCDPFPPLSNTLPRWHVPNEVHNGVILDSTHPGERTPYPLLSQTLIEAIKMALHSQKRVILFLNRTGVAKRLECGDCHHVPFCGTCGNLPSVRLNDLLCTNCGTEMWKPLRCPACQSSKIGLRAIGGEKIAASLETLFPTVTVGTLSKGKAMPESTIVVATEYFWSSVYEPFHPYSFGLVAELLADIGFTPGDYTGAEGIARKMARLMHFARRENASCIIQTVARDRLLTLLGVQYAYEQEMLARERYCLPPFGVIVTFTHCTQNELPDIIAAHVSPRANGLVAKIDHETFLSWQALFPAIPDAIKIHIAQ